MSGRKPRKDELELWAQVANKTKPLPKAKPDFSTSGKTTPRTRHVQAEPTTFQVMRPVAASKKPNHLLQPDLQSQFATAAVAMDQKAFRQMRRGKLRPDGKIDLHGMTQDRAHSALTRFIFASFKSDKRLLLVITGKGKQREDDGPIPVRYGVLKHKVPEWLRLQPLASMVLQVAPAHISHGGSGAYYVYLRRRS